jgi:hypothetical protein
MRIIYRQQPKSNYKLGENNHKRDRKIFRPFNFQLPVIVFRLKELHLACHIHTELAAMQGFSFHDRLPQQNPNKSCSKLTGEVS